MNGWTEPIILMWPMCEMVRVPFCGLNAQSKIERCRSASSDAPSIVPVASMCAVIELTWLSV